MFAAVLLFIIGRPRLKFIKSQTFYVPFEVTEIFTAIDGYVVIQFSFARAFLLAFDDSNAVIAFTAIN